MTWQSNWKPSGCACASGARTMSSRYARLLLRSAVAALSMAAASSATTYGGAIATLSRTLAAQGLRPVGARRTGERRIRRAIPDCGFPWNSPMSKSAGALPRNPRQGLCDRGGRQAPATSASAAWAREAGQLHQAGQCRFDPGGRAPRRQPGRRVHACTASRTSSICHPQPSEPCRQSLKENHRMSLKIRLSRAGAKKRPYYHIVVAEARRAARRQVHRNDRHVQSDAAARRREARAARCGEGRQTGSRRARSRPTACCASSTRPGSLKRDARNNPEKASPSKKRQEREKAAADAAAKAAEAARRRAAADSRSRRDELGKDLILVGHITGAHGIKGEVKLKSFTEDPRRSPPMGRCRSRRWRPVEIVTTQARRGGPHRHPRRRYGQQPREALHGRSSTWREAGFPSPAPGTVYQADLIGLEVKPAPARRSARWRSRQLRRRRSPRDRGRRRGETLLVPFADDLAEPRWTWPRGGSRSSFRKGYLDRGVTAVPASKPPCSRLFPDMFPGPLALSLAGKALAAGIWSLDVARHPRLGDRSAPHRR